MMTWTKLKIAAAVVAAVTIGGTTGVLTVKNAIAAERQPGTASATKPSAPADAAPAKLKKKDNMGIISVQDSPPVVISTVPPAGSTEVAPAATTDRKVALNNEAAPGG